MSTSVRARWPAWAITGMVAAYAATFSWLAIARHRSFFTARYDLGNMTQAVWSASRGEWFRVTDGDGEQLSRLGAHVDPILGVFAPLWKLWPDPIMLMVVQAIVVATMAIPAYLLAKRWLADERLAVAFAAVTLLLPAVQWATVFDFHPVTLAAPLIMWCAWAAVERKDVTLVVLAIATVMTKEQVGLALAILGIWMIVALKRRLAGSLVAIWGVGWTAIAIKVIIPANSPTGQSPLLEERYGELGSSVGDVLLSLVTRPWDAVAIMAGADQGVYLLALLLPLLCLSLLSPLLAAGALPDLVLNVLSSRPQQHAIEYHYSAVIAPFLTLGAIAGLARLRRMSRPQWLQRLTERSRLTAATLVCAALLGNYLLGPLPMWSHLPGGSDTKADEYTPPARADALRAAVALIPKDVVVSAGNRIGAHLSARRRILTFPVVADAQYVVVDTVRPDIRDVVRPVEHRQAVAELRARTDFTVAFESEGVIVFRRTA